MIRKPLILQTAGATLIEVLTAVGLFAIVAAALAVANFTFLKGGRDVKARTVRDQIVNQIRMTATDKKSIILSAKDPLNQGFFNCLCGVNTCANMKSPPEVFTLLDSGGLIQSPTFFTGEGNPCNPPMQPSQCQIRVRTTYSAQCMPALSSGNQNPPLSCDGVPAEFIAISYTVDENPDFAGSDRVKLRPITGPAYIQVLDYSSEACP